MVLFDYARRKSSTLIKSFIETSFKVSVLWCVFFNVSVLHIFSGIVSSVSDSVTWASFAVVYSASLSAQRSKTISTTKISTNSRLQSAGCAYNLNCWLQGRSSVFNSAVITTTASIFCQCVVAPSLAAAVQAAMLWPMSKGYIAEDTDIIDELINS